jgi:hypothetical protein
VRFAEQTAFYNVANLTDGIGHEGPPEETEMKKSLLATVAAVALFAATGMAAAAEGGRDHGGSAGMSQSGAAMSHGAGKADTNRAAEMKGKSETTGAGSAEHQAEGRDAKSGPSPDSNKVKKDVAPKAGSKANAEKAKPSTTGQASEKSAPATKSGAMDKEPAAKSSTNEKSAPTAKSAADEKSGAAASKSSAQNQAGGSTGGSVSLTSDQKTKIRTTVLRSGSAPKVSRSSINFNIRVGTVVPRSVHFVTVPETLVEIHPAWRGYSYFIVDEEIVIVEPSTFKIVAVLTV